MTLKRSVAIVVTAGLVSAAGMVPAQAKKRSDEHGSFTAQAVPFPNPSAQTNTEHRSCLQGVEGVHKVSFPYVPKRAGRLEAYMEDFVGDWDLFVTDENGDEIAGSVNDQATAGAPAAEQVTLSLKKNQAVQIVACNWIGGPEAEAHYDYFYKKAPKKKKKKGHHHH